VSDSGATPPRYFVNRVVDPLVIGLASVLLYGLFRIRPSMAMSPMIVSIGAFLVWGVNYPHFASTNYRLYHSKENVRQYPMTALVTPLLMGGATVACFLSPTSIAPAFVKLYNLWSPYHFSGQTLGITMVYARRFGYKLDGWLRRMLTIFIFCTFIFQSARAEVGNVDRTFYGVTYPSLGIPAWVADVARTAMLVAVAAFIVLLFVRMAVARKFAPLMVLLPAFTQFIWFAATPAGQFTYLVPFFHSMQYLLLAWSLQLKQRLDQRHLVPSRRFVWSESARWMSINVVGGYTMFWLMPRIGSQFGRSMAFSTAIVLAALQLHHFFVDGVIWRLRNPGVRSPLGSSLGEVSGRVPVLAAAT
jgi:hypothetical protein